jgi:phospholipase A1
VPVGAARPPFGALSMLLPLDQTEGKFQLSFKFKLADLDDTIGASVWAGYTQQSHWQVYNGEQSRPFRETNYEPEGCSRYTLTSACGASMSGCRTLES